MSGASQVVQWVANSCNAEDVGSITGWEDPKGESMEAHSSILPWENCRDRGAWRATEVHGVTNSQDMAEGS